MRRLLTLFVVGMVVAACGSEASDPTSTTRVPTDVGSTTTAPTTTTLPASPTTTAAATTTTSTSTTTTTTSETSRTPSLPLAPVSPLPTLADGRPATFLAVTTDFAAVEVATDTGELIREIGQLDDAEAVENAETEAVIAIVDYLWRTVDGSQIGVSVCCEPARGAIFFVGLDENLRTAGDSVPGWAGAGSPVDNTSAVVGYGLVVSSPAEQIYSEELLEGFMAGTPTYSRDGTAVYWISDTGSDFFLQVRDFTAGSPERTAFRLDWLAGDQRLVGLTTNAEGHLVAFATDDAFEQTEAVVIDAAGDLVARFDVPDRATLGGYDPSGRFLIFVDDDGVARWLGPEGEGELGPGYLYAVW